MTRVRWKAANNQLKGNSISIDVDTRKTHNQKNERSVLILYLVGHLCWLIICLVTTDIQRVISTETFFFLSIKFLPRPFNGSISKCENVQLNCHLVATNSDRLHFKSSMLFQDDGNVCAVCCAVAFRFRELYKKNRTSESSLICLFWFDTVARVCV